MSTKEQELREKLEVMVCNILTLADTIYEGMTFDEIRQSLGHSDSQKIVTKVDNLFAQITSSNAEAYRHGAYDELKRFEDTGEFDLPKAIDDRLAELVDKDE